MKNFILTIAISFFALLGANAQNDTKTKSADKKYEKFAYIEATKTYERLFEKGYKSADMLEKLGNSYYFNADLVNAAKWYGELFKLDADAISKVDAEYYYRYSQSLKGLKDYKKADQMMAIFTSKNANDERGKLASSQKDYLQVIKKNSGRFNISNAATNSKESDYGSGIYDENKLVFASARDKSALKQNWTGRSYTNFYEANRAEDGSLSAPVKFSSKLNSEYNESSAVFTSDGLTVYFTRNNFLNGKRKNDINKTTLLKLYRAYARGSSWSKITELPFNSDQYNVAHPALSADEKTLYFASDMPGSFGQSDIYKVKINSDLSYGTPENLGKAINTEGRETFPFVSTENELYFASDGHPGLGGLDVFVSKIEKNKTFGPVFNVGEPINSNLDDFAFIVNSQNGKGYFSSNRDGGMGSDDIYFLQQTRKLETECEQLLAGIVTDLASGQAVSNAKVTLSDANFKVVKELFTGTDGKFDFGKVNCDSKYYLKTEARDYTTVETPTVTAAKSGTDYVPVNLEKVVKPLAKDDDIGGTLGFNIKMIYFDLDKSNIRPDAAVELAKILDVLQENPTMEIDIRSHTDSRAATKYNENLSNRRAKSSAAWLIKNGINKKRITAKGYGESQLVNGCSDGVECTDEQHQANRRSEFIITKL